MTLMPSLKNGLFMYPTKPTAAMLTQIHSYNSFPAKTNARGKEMLGAMRCVVTFVKCIVYVWKYRNEHIQYIFCVQHK